MLEPPAPDFPLVRGPEEWFLNVAAMPHQMKGWPAMATHHQSRRVEYIARDIDTLASNLETEARHLREMSTALRDATKDDGEPLTPDERYNIRENVRRAVFSPMRSGSYAVSVETMLYGLDRFIEEVQ